MATAETLMQNGITAYFHCAQCLAVRPDGVSPAEFARFAVGKTPYGIQIWCVRHNVNVYHLDITSGPRPAACPYAEETDAPFAEDLSLACQQCGFDPVKPPPGSPALPHEEMIDGQ